MPIFDPALWKFLSHGDETAWQDFSGTHALLHKQFEDAIRRLGGVPYPSLPLSPTSRGQWLLPEPPGLKFPYYPGDDWMEAHQTISDGEAASLIIAAAPDLRSYDFQNPEEFSTWCLLHSQEMTRIRQAIGI